MTQDNFEGYIAHGISTREYLSNFSSEVGAAEDMFDYITGQAADETEIYDPETAAEMRETHYQDILIWVREHWNG